MNKMSILTSYRVCAIAMLEVSKPSLKKLIVWLAISISDKINTMRKFYFRNVLAEVVIYLKFPFSFGAGSGDQENLRGAHCCLLYISKIDA